MKKIFTLFFSCLVTIVPLSAKAAVQVADIFGSHMVLQCGMDVPVWGITGPGEEVTVSFAGQKKSDVADAQGRWRVTLAPMPGTSEPRNLVVSSEGSDVTMNNVLVGEVWLVIGHWIGKQYGMEGPVPDPMIRVRSYGGGSKNTSPTPRTAFGKNAPWISDRSSSYDLLTTPFANRIHRETGHPVGVVRLEVGELDAIIPVDGFTAIQGLEDLAAQVSTWYPDTIAGKKAYAKWYTEMEAWKKKLDKQLANGVGVMPSQPPIAPGPVHGDRAQPTVAFNAQLKPIVPFAFRGALHVHDGGMAEPATAIDLRYPEKMRALVAGLRKVFEQEDLPFCFSQRNQPYCRHAHTAGGMQRYDIMNFSAWGGHRDRQRRVLPLSDTGMIVTVDLENYSGDVGERFARWALAEVYGKGKETSGPLYKSHRVDGDSLIIEFDHADSGLMAACFPEIGKPLAEQEESPLRFFAVAGQDRIFHSADARIKGNKVIVRSDAVKKPVAVRYAFHFDPRGMNLYNREGLPASPFNTDDWAIANFDETVEEFKDKKTEELVAMLGYPTMLHSHAAAKALASKGEDVVLPVVKNLLLSESPDQRCGGLRTLGYLYWMGIITRRYYGDQPQEVTPAVSSAIGIISQHANDANPHVRRTVAEALALIGSENDAVFQVIRKLAVDDDALVRTAALRTCKYRFNTHDHNTKIAHEVLAKKPFGDRVTLELAGTIINHFRLDGPVDYLAVGRYLGKIGPGQGGEVVGSLGDMLRRYPYKERKKALGHPEVMPAILNIYSIGYRKYFLYGVWHWVDVPEHEDAISGKIKWLGKEIVRLKREKPAGWDDLVARFADAIEGLEDVKERYIYKKKKK